MGLKPATSRIWTQCSNHLTTWLDEQIQEKLIIRTLWTSFSEIFCKISSIDEVIFKNVRYYSVWNWVNDLVRTTFTILTTFVRKRPFIIPTILKPVPFQKKNSVYKKTQNPLYFDWYLIDCLVVFAYRFYSALWSLDSFEYI